MNEKDKLKFNEEPEIRQFSSNNKDAFVTYEEFHKQLNEIRTFQQKITSTTSKLTAKIEKIERENSLWKEDENLKTDTKTVIEAINELKKCNDEQTKNIQNINNTANTYKSIIEANSNSILNNTKEIKNIQNNYTKTNEAINELKTYSDKQDDELNTNIKNATETIKELKKYNDEQTKNIQKINNTIKSYEPIIESNTKEIKNIQNNYTKTNDDQNKKITNKQNIQDDNLETNAKTIVEAINEIKQHNDKQLKIIQEKISNQEKEIEELKKKIKVNLDTIITNTNLENLYIGTSTDLSKQTVLKAIINKNPNAKNLTLNDFEIIENSKTKTQLKIVGARKWQGVIILKYQEIKNFIKILNNPTYSSTIDIHGNLYAGSDSGIVYKSISGSSPFTELKGVTGAIWSLISDKNGNIYAAGFEKIYKSNGYWHFTEMQGPKNQRPNSLATDKNGNVYVAMQKGIYKSINGEEPFIRMHGITREIHSLTSNIHNNIYAGRDNGIIHKSINADDKFIKMKIESKMIILSLISDKDGNIYARDLNSIYKNINDSLTFTKIEIKNIPSLPTNFITDKNGNLYVSNQNDKEVYKSIGGNQPFIKMYGINDEITSLSSDINGNIYATGKNGIYKAENFE